ncbi:CPBP family intramembrane metalloprotease [bacterium]|nr:CPBP family intramembrane metalloprotease [candidate division CSSED10-310 bacterium]
MIKNDRLKIPIGIGISAAIALIALYVTTLVPLPKDGFIPGSFITHSLMLGLSLMVMLLIPNGGLSSYGFTKGTYRFRPKILLWALPTAVLASIALVATGGAEASSMLQDFSRLQLFVFVWIYASVCEEVLTRGLLQTLISGHRNDDSRKRIFTTPVVISGLFFGAMHTVLIPSMGPRAAVPIVLTTLLGFLAAHYRRKTGSLIPAIIVHALFNVGGMLPGWIFTWITG